MFLSEYKFLKAILLFFSRFSKNVFFLDKDVKNCILVKNLQDVKNIHWAEINI